MAVDFWFSIGSTYTFLSIMRLPQLGTETGIEFRWRPFNVRAIMIAMDNIPFANKPAKAAYMWRDVERRAAHYGLTARLPIPYPLAGLEVANRVAVLAASEGWCEAYATATYRRWFSDGEAPGSEPNLSSSIAEAGQAPARVLKFANSPAGVEGLSLATARLRSSGIRLTVVRRGRRAVLGR